MESIRDLVTALACLLFSAQTLATIIIWRWFRHRETMAMLEQGVTPTRERPAHPAHRLLIIGVILAAVGLALAVGFLLVGWTALARVPQADTEATLEVTIFFLVPAVIIGLIPFLTGLALVGIHFYLRGQKESSALLPETSDESRREGME